MQRIRQLGLLLDDGPLPRSLLEACFEERLAGGLSLSSRATPDEVVGPLTHLMGGSATRFKVLDVRGGKRPQLEFRWGAVEGRWPLSTVEDLVERLGDLFLEEEDVRPLVVLGEHEGMLQLWAVRAEVLEVLLGTRLLESAWNLATLRARFGEDDGFDDEEE